MRFHATMILLVLVTMLVTTVASTGPVGALSPSFLSTKGVWVVDSNNRPVILRGVNYPGYDWCNSDSDPIMHKENDYATFAKSGFNVVRLPISWCLLEPQPGFFLRSYLDIYVGRDIRLAKKYGLYIVLDLHQWKWANRFGGGGAPDWAVQQYPPNESGERMAISNFWVNQTLQKHFADLWGKIARTFANEPTVAGYDILNEPFVYTSVIPYLNGSYVDSFYMKVIKSIRAVDSKHIIFLEPSNMVTSNFPIKDKIVWSPHFYPLSFYPQYHPENITYLEADLAVKYAKFVIGMEQPMWIGEFGGFMAEGNEAWLADATSLFAKYQVGWAWWAFSGRSIPTCLYTTNS